jgi:2-hydroxy-3-keto-5-methylthiopentenyl-1-phosphate phosphatase
LAAVFSQYTGNLISLGEAVGQIRQLWPAPITPEQMDAYLEDSFSTYTAVPELVEWCLSHNILFMINTTGMVGYFQRIFAKRLFPPVPVISAHPLMRFPQNDSDPFRLYELLQIQDKSTNTGRVARTWAIPTNKLILLGDSGGDGPHFEWGAANGAFLIASMIKPSLTEYCREKNIVISRRFGLDYSQGKNEDRPKEMKINFMDLASSIEDIVNRQSFGL